MEVKKMPKLKSSYEKILGRRISDTTYWRHKKLLESNGIVPNRQSLCTFGIVKKDNLSNLESLIKMKNWTELSNIIPSKKSELINFLKSQNVPYQTYHRWLSKTNNPMTTNELSEITTKLINWRIKKNGNNSTVRQIPPQKDGN